MQSLRVVTRNALGRRLQVPRSEVCHVGRAIGERRVRAAAVVERDVTRVRRACFTYRVVDPEIHLLVLGRLPEALDEHVVQPVALAFHADGDVAALEHAVVVFWKRSRRGGEAMLSTGISNANPA